MRAVLDHCSDGVKHSVAAGDTIIREGQTSGHLFVLIEGQLTRVFVELLEIAAEPMGERRIDPLDRLSPRVGGATRRGSATTGLQRNDDGDPLVESAGEQ